MDLRGSRILVIGGGGFIGSHVVEELLVEDVEAVIVYDNFCRGVRGNLEGALSDSRCRIFEEGGDILQTEILNAAMRGVDGVVHLAALWLLQCYEYPEAAFEVNRGDEGKRVSAADAMHFNTVERSATATPRPRRA